MQYRTEFAWFSREVTREAAIVRIVEESSEFANMFKSTDIVAC